MCRERLHLDRIALARAAVGLEQVFGGLALDDTIGDRVGMGFVLVPALADVAFELHAATLLHDVGGLVSGRVQVG